MSIKTWSCRWKNGTASDWLFYERISAQWHAGVYVDLLMAENHAVTDRSDGSVFWFYVDTLDKVFINLCLAVDNDPETGMVQGILTVSLPAQNIIWNRMEAS